MTRARRLPCGLKRSPLWGGLGGFTQRYGIKRLVWFEVHETMESAIRREKSIKRWPRA
jgi:predicted GIY-YIG superfamily endonuclease